MVRPPRGGAGGRAEVVGRRRPRPLPTGVALAVLAGLVMVPMVWLLLITFKPEGEIGASPLRLLPVNPTGANYEGAVTFIDYTRYLGSSVAVATIYTVPTVITSAMAGYAFARLNARFKQALFAVVIATLLVPLLVFVLPLFIIYSRIGLLNTYWPWLFWGLGANAFHIFLFRQFFDALPKEMEEAAEIDGCGKLRTLWSVVLPNSKPVLATSAILAFASQWGEIIVQNIFLNSDERATLSARLAIGIMDPSGRAILNGVTLAAVALYIVPVIAVFVIAQRSIIRGAMTSGLK
jgi:ABC-type glycerol-3-phosphate transport system permease component